MQNDAKKRLNSSVGFCVARGESGFFLREKQLLIITFFDSFAFLAEECNNQNGSRSGWFSIFLFLASCHKNRSLRCLALWDNHSEKERAFGEGNNLIPELLISREFNRSFHRWLWYENSDWFSKRNTPLNRNGIPAIVSLSSLLQLGIKAIKVIFHPMFNGWKQWQLSTTNPQHSADTISCH